MKRCSKCGKLKSRDEFNKRTRSKGGLCSQCKVCCRVYKQSNQGKAANARYRRSKKGKIAQVKYRQSEKGKRANARGKKKYRQTVKGDLCDHYHNFNQRCNDSKAIGYEYYGAKKIKNLFGSFDNFYHHVAVDLGLTYDNIRGKDIHRIHNGNYEIGNIEFLTPKNHKQKHKEMNRARIIGNTHVTPC